MVLSATALAIAIVSSFFNGSFPVWQRCSKVSDPVIFNGIVSLGVFVCSAPVPAFAGRPYVFTLLGFCGGALFVFAVLFTFIAIPRAGLATSQAIWCTSAILVSFAWGSCGPKEVTEPLSSVPLSLLAVLLLTSGALLIVFSPDLASGIFRSEAAAGRPEADSQGDSLEYSGYQDLQDQKNSLNLSANDRITGLASAAIVGLFGGSILVPFKFIPVEKSGLAAVPSFGLGALVVGAAVTCGYLFICHRSAVSMPDKASVAAGIMSGATWNAGNLCSIVAQNPPFNLPYGIAYPILQCAMLFGGIWGVCVFREIRGASIAVFWAGACILILGVVILSSYGPGSELSH